MTKQVQHNIQTIGLIFRESAVASVMSGQISVTRIIMTGTRITTTIIRRVTG